jgi:hypothetical protein
LDRQVLGTGFAGHEVHGERLPPAVAGHGLKSHFRSRDEQVRVAIEYGCMQKYILTAIVRRDKSVSARWVEL